LSEGDNPYAPGKLESLTDQRLPENSGEPTSASSWIARAILTLLVSSLASFACGMLFVVISVRGGGGGDFAPMLAIGNFLIGGVLGAVVGFAISVFVLALSQRRQR
jgi:H+/Cl- antiporter ClcA